MPVDKCIQSQHLFLHGPFPQIITVKLSPVPSSPEPDTITHPSQISMCHRWKVHGKNIRECSDGKKTKLCKRFKPYVLQCPNFLSVRLGGFSRGM